MLHRQLGNIEALLTEAAGDFSLHATTDALNIVQETGSSLTLRVKRTGGFEGAIDLEVDGLPDGVTFAPPQVPAKANSVKLTFKATADAPSRAYPLAITGSARIGVDNKTVRHRLAAGYSAREAWGGFRGLCQSAAPTRASPFSSRWR